MLSSLLKNIMSVVRGSSKRNWTDDALEREDLVTNDKHSDDDKTSNQNSIPPAFETRYRDLERTCRNLKRGLVIFALLCTSIVLALIFPWSSSSKARQHMPGESQILDTEEIPLDKVVFERDDRFAGSSNEITDEAWASMMPPGDGFIGTSSSQLPPSFPPGIGKTASIYDTSLFHELHCLTHIRTYLYTMQSALNQTDPLRTFEVLLEPQAEHVEHCFDYLRQGVMCAGDLTLEWPRQEADGRRFAVDGWGVEHECKSWNAVMKFMDERSVVRHRTPEAWRAGKSATV